MWDYLLERSDILFFKFSRCTFFCSLQFPVIFWKVLQHMTLWDIWFYWHTNYKKKIQRSFKLHTNLFQNTHNSEFPPKISSLFPSQIFSRGRLNFFSFKRRYQRMIWFRKYLHLSNPAFCVLCCQLGLGWMSNCIINQDFWFSFPPLFCIHLHFLNAFFEVFICIVFHPLLVAM